MEVKKIMVVGAGLMGNGIAQTAISYGYDTILSDVADEFIKRGVANIDSRLERKVARKEMTPEEKQRTMARLTTTIGLSEASKADVVIEAVFENLEVKRKVYAELDSLCRPETILASNTSALSITALGGATKRPDKVIGMHFLQPVPVMPLVNVIRGLLTSEETFNTILKLAKSLGKEAKVWKDCPGHGLQLPGLAYYNETAYVLFEGRGTKEDMDRCYKVGMGMTMGPVETIDFMGIDTTVDIMRYLYSSYGQQRFFPCPLLVQMVDAKLLGTKSGKGFYEYGKK